MQKCVNNPILIKVAISLIFIQLTVLSNLENVWAYGDMLEDGRPEFMRHMSEEAVRKYYLEQAEIMKKKKLETKELMDLEKKRQLTGKELGKLDSQTQEKLRLAQEKMKKAQENQRKGFGKMKLSVVGPDLTNRNMLNLNFDMELGINSYFKNKGGYHPYGCYSSDASSIGIVAKKLDSGILQEVNIKIEGIQDDGDKKNENLQIIGKKDGKMNFNISIPGEYFQRMGTRNIGEILFTKHFTKEKFSLRINSWIRYHGCPLDEGPEGGSGASSGSGYGNY